MERWWMGLVSHCLPVEALGSLMISHCPANLSDFLFWRKPQSPGTGSLGAFSGWWIHQAPSKSDWQSMSVSIQLGTDRTLSSRIVAHVLSRWQLPRTARKSTLGTWVSKEAREEENHSNKWTYIWASVTWSQWIPRIWTLTGFSCVVMKLQYYSPLGSRGPMGRPPGVSSMMGSFPELASLLGMCSCLKQQQKSICLA